MVKLMEIPKLEINKYRKPLLNPSFLSVNQCKISPQQKSSLEAMQSQAGFFVMLSFLAGSKDNFQLKGTCPSPRMPSTILHFNDTVFYRYQVALHYNSEKEHVDLNGNILNNLNCVALTFQSGNEGIRVELSDCEFYQVDLEMTETQNYNLSLRNRLLDSKCENQMTQIENLSVWSDEKNEFLVFWGCTNDTQLTSHKQGVVVFVIGDLVVPDWNEYLDMSVFRRLRKFTEETLKFTGLNWDDFYESEQLKEYPKCDFLNCTTKCAALTVGDEGMSFINLTVLFIVMLIFFIIICFMIL